MIDEILPIKGADALRLARELAQKEGILTGITGGATFAGALQIAARGEQGAKILCMLPDTGERYLSTPLFEDIPAEMTSEEIEISRSTPRCRFDVSASAHDACCACGRGSLRSSIREAQAFVDKVTNDAERPVVMFAHEWCEFCWSVRRLFKEFDIPYRSVDLDAVDYRKDDRGGKIRNVLSHRTGSVTIPQIFVGSRHIGGCTETFDAFNDGRLHAAAGRARQSRVKPRGDVNAYSFLPKWLQPR